MEYGNTRCWWRGVMLACCLSACATVCATLDVPPALLRDETVMFPLRYIAEWFGADVQYDKIAGRVQIQRKGHSIRLVVNRQAALVDNKPVTLETPAFVRAGVTYVPLRFLAEAVEARVDSLPGQGQMLSVRDPGSGDALLLRVVDEGDVDVPPLPVSAAAQRVLAAAEAGDLTTLRAALDAAPKLRDARDTRGNTPLMRAAIGGRPEAVAVLLDRRAAVQAVNADGQSALHRAAAGGWRDVTAALIGGGARFNSKDTLGQTPLHLAARYGHAEIARLLRYGAAVDAKDIYGQTPLVQAARGGHPQVATVLLDAGAAVNATDIDRYTPLHRAAAAGIPELVTLLRDHGADLTARAKGGATPRTLAHPAVARLLRNKDQ